MYCKQPEFAEALIRKFILPPHTSSVKDQTFLTASPQGEAFWVLPTPTIFNSLFMTKKTLPISLTKSQRNLGWFWWAFQLLFLPLILTEGNRYLGAPVSEAELNFIFFCLNFAATTLILWRFALASCKQGLRRVFYTLQSAFLGFALYYLLTFLLGLATRYFFPDYVNQNDSSILYMLQENRLLISIGTILLAPVAEELMYRGVIFGSLHSRSRFFAYALSAVLFSVVHIMGHLPDPLTFVISFVQYLPAGFCLAWAYERSGSILAPILMHIAINQMGISRMF